jgi:ferric-dicitrate binding protein FerR (iron transport regulator)
MNERNDFTDDDAEIAELLRQVGTREEPSADTMRDVEAAVQAEWRHVLAQRQRRRTAIWAAAASVCALAVGAFFTVRLMDTQGQPVATLLRTDGEVFLASDGQQWSRIRAGQRIAVGNSIRSDARAALQLDSGLAVRADRGTSFKITDTDRLALNVGAVYVDSRGAAVGNALVIETHAGSVRHLGTQYQVRTRRDGIDVSVREGRVMIEGEGGSNVAAAGEHLSISMQGSVQRAALAPTDEQWRWASEVAPTFVIENASLATFLDWISHETGRPLVYATPTARSAAAGEILHGSIEGLALDVALAAVLATTSLRRDETNPDVIAIGLAGAIDSTRASRPTP